MAVTLRYFIEFGKRVFQHITVSNRSVAEFMHESSRLTSLQSERGSNDNTSWPL